MEEEEEEVAGEEEVATTDKDRAEKTSAYHFISMHVYKVKGRFQ